MPVDGDAFGKRFELRLGDLAERAGAVGADDAGARQLQLALQLAVVGEQQQALGHEVEAADRHQRAAGRAAAGRRSSARPLGSCAAVIVPCGL